MNHDTELEMWRRYWETPDRGDSPMARVDEPAWGGLIRDRVARQSRRLWMGLLAPILVTAAAGGVLVARAMRLGRFIDYAAALEGGLFIIVVWVCCLRLARGTWKPLAQSTAAFVDLAIRRTRSNLAIARLSPWLYAGQIILGAAVGWSQHESGALVAYFTSWPLIVMGWIGVPIFIAWLIWYCRRQAAELQRLLELKRQLANDVDAALPDMTTPLDAQY
jgi:hypothetical protein